MHKGLKAVLFDFDGVIVDTEEQYTEFWADVARHYLPKEKDFATRIKGQSLTDVFDRYFPDSAVQESIRHNLDEAQKTMRYDYIPGAPAFVQVLRDSGIKTAVVTSSDNAKMNRVYALRPEIATMFDRVFTSEDYCESKPSPDCFITAARYFGFEPCQCVVAEDSINGLKAAGASGSFVLGLSTTNTPETVGKYADLVIPDFSNFTIKGLETAFEACGRC